MSYTLFVLHCLPLLEPYVYSGLALDSAMPSSFSEWNQEGMNVRNYMVDLTHFFTFFFHPMMYFVHTGMRACLFTEGEGYHTRMRTGQLPTKMDDAQDPHSPTLHTSHRE